MGLFGYVNGGIIKGVNIININVQGNDYVGGIAGKIDTGTINDIIFSGTIKGNNYVGGIAGERDNTKNNTTKLTNLYVKDVNVEGTERVGGVVGYIYNYYNGSTVYLTGVIEKGSVTGESTVGEIYGHYYSHFSTSFYASTSVTTSGSSQGVSYTLKENLLNGYDGQLDTWIGGDNDSSGYYFDYDKKGEIVIRSVEQYPITFNLAGSGTEEDPYLIGNYQDWKEATTKVKNGYYFKITNDIDFNNKLYYAMGTGGNAFNGVIDGDFNTISNITMNGINNVGIVGYNNAGTIKELNIDNMTVTSGKENVGGIVGYNTGTIQAINVNNVNIQGTNYVGGITGRLAAGKVNEITLSGTVKGNEYVGGAIGRRENVAANMTNIYVKDMNVTGSRIVGGIVGHIYNYNTSVAFTGVMEKGSVTGTEYVGNLYGHYYSHFSTSFYASTSVTTSGSSQGVSYTLKENLLNGYDGQLDTWIGGDNDSSGYYFDYDDNGNLVIRSVEEYPITFNLAGSGTEEDPYLIGNYQDYKEATTKVSGGYYYKIINDIDFKDKNYYQMGTGGNAFNGVIDGDFNTISNITMNGINNTGLIGYNNGGIIKELNIDNVNVSANNYVGALVGNNNTGDIIAINANNINVSGNDYSGGLIGYLNAGNVNETMLSGTIKGNDYVGGVIGRTGNNTNTVKSILISNVNVTGNNYIGGMIGHIYNSSYKITVSGIVETGNIIGSSYIGRMYGSYYSSSRISIKTYASTLLSISNSSTAITSYSYSGDDIQNLGYYSTLLDTSNNPIIESEYTGDINATGYYFDYGNDGYIRVVPVDGDDNNTPSPDPAPQPDPDYTVTSIVGTTDTTAPTCELYYVRAVSNGIQASFSCTDDSGVPTLRSLFDSTTSKSAQTFDNIGTLKNGSVSGNTKTVVSTWNVYNTVSQPTPGTCYYFRYGAQDAEGNFSTYVTNICYKGFSQ